MILRFSTIVWMMLVVVAAVMLYFVKYQVQDLKEEVAAVERELREERDSMHVLNAEWSYLSRPERIRELAEKHLALTASDGKQMVETADVPYPDAPNQVAQTPSMVTPAKVEIDDQ